jgi:MEDS: MEthanogen/methylotroph, DcmR Sensory domain
MEQLPRHQCLIYEGSPAAQLPAVAATIQKKLKENHRCLYLNSPPMVAGLRSYLFACGVDVPREVMQGSLVLSSDCEHLQNEMFDIDRMLNLLDGAVSQALHDGYDGVWATGDMSWEFGPKKDFSKLLEYEWRLEELFHKQPTLSGMCQYHTDSLPSTIVRQGLLTHQAIFINDTLSQLNSHYVRRESFSEHFEESVE